MTRLTQAALSPSTDTSGDDSQALPCWTDHQRLPFNNQSPTWNQPRMERPAALERMTRLVKTLEAEVIPRLVEAHRTVPATEAPVPSATCPPPTEAEISDFVQLVFSLQSASVSSRVETYRERGMTIENVYLQLLAPAARHMGYLWDEDLCNFTQVTVGLGRLQHLLQALSPAFGTDVEFPANARRVVLVPAPGEQHTFGLSMVAEFFLHAGWEVAGGQGGHHGGAVDMVRQEWFDVIGFSVGSETRLDWLKTCVSEVRAASCNPSIRVMVGGPIFTLHPEFAEVVGADATSTDGKQAPIVAEGLVASRVRHV
jgi:methanogenic corrinoid protein MtbC1